MTEFLIFPAVGAVIGALTNKIAIRMLFHPYKAWYIGRWRVPMTPGVIPQQRETIAANIATTFDANLLSGDDIHQALTGETAHRQMDAKVEEILEQLGPFASVARPFKPKIVDAVLEGLEAYIKELIASGGELDIRQRIEDRINAMETAKLEELIMGFSEKQFRYITIFGGLIGGLIGLFQAGIAQLL